MKNQQTGKQEKSLFLAILTSLGINSLLLGILLGIGYLNGNWITMHQSF